MNKLVNSFSGLTLVALLLLGTSCQSVKDVDDKSAPVYLTMQTDAASIESDVFNIRTGGALSDTMGISLQNNPKSESPIFPTETAANLASIQVTNMRVTYTRTDGGVAVPQSFEQPVSLTIPVDQTQLSNIVVVPAAYKLIEPLSRLRGGGVDQATGLSFIMCNAFVEFWGKTNSGHSVYTSGGFRIEFADFADV